MSSSKTTNSYKIAIVVLSIAVVALLALLARGGQAEPAATVTVTVTPSQQAQPTAVAEGSATPSEAPEPEQPTSDQEQERIEFLLNLPRRQADDARALGKVDAPVVLTEWADFRCPFCSVWDQDTLPKLKPLIDDGTLRVEFRDMAIFGEDSVKAAAASRAAGAEGKFWEFVEALYAAIPQQGHPPVSDELLLQLAQQIGISDLDAFKAGFQDDEKLAEVAAETREGQTLGVNSTPTFLVGSQVVSGAQPAEQFIKIIEQEKAKQG
ncbi:MAG: disulfide bond formation protein [Arachnia propionica]|nr:MAG: disulfide bond formation protein [Arachnia propionica]